jgi:hypothetical protein
VPVLLAIDKGPFTLLTKPEKNAKIKRDFYVQKSSFRINTIANPPALPGVFG